MTTATLEQAPPPADNARRIPGNKGIWVGITCEFVEFAVLFAVYFIPAPISRKPSMKVPSA